MSLHNPTERVINVLLLVSKCQNSLTLSNISKQLNIPKSTLSPILKALVEMELLNFEMFNQTYSIGLKSFEIGQSYLSNINGLEIIKSHMRNIVNECNEVCQLGINHRDKVLYLAKVENNQPIKLLSSIGRNLPLYCTALGRALLFEYSEDEIRNIYPNKLEKFTEYTVTDINEIIELLKKCKLENYTYENREITQDTCCVAVPIVIDGSVQAAIGVSLPIVRAEKRHLKKIIELLKIHTNLISKELKDLDIDHILF